MRSLLKQWRQPNFPFSPRRLPIFYGWVIVFASTIGMISTIPGQTAGTGPFKESLMRALHLDSIQVSTAYFIGTFTAGLLLPRMGKWFDIAGARSFTFLTQLVFGAALIYLASVGKVFTFLNGSPTKNVWLAMVLLTVGYLSVRLLGQGMITMASRALIGKWFNYLRGKANAINATLTSCAFASAPWSMTVMIQTFEWDKALYLLGIGMLLVMAPLCWLLFRDNPEECGLVMDGRSDLKAPTGKDDEFTINHEFTGEEAIRTFPFWAFTLGISFLGYFGTAVAFHIEDFARDVGMSTSDFALLYLIAQPLQIVLGIAFNYISTYIRLKYLLVTMLMGNLCASLGVYELPSALGYVLFIGGNCVAWSGFGTLLAIVFPRFFGRKHLGKISGWTMFSLVISSAIAPLAFSLFQQATGDYRLACQTFAVASFILLLTAFKADNPQRKLAKST